MSGKVKVGILGATGAVGQRFVQQLEGHPWFEIHALGASERSAGKSYGGVVRWLLSTTLPERTAVMQVSIKITLFHLSLQLFFSLEFPPAHHLILTSCFRCGRVMLLQKKHHSRSVGLSSPLWIHL